MDAESSDTAEDCSKPKMLSYINIGLSVMHIAIAVYVQNAICKKITTTKEENGEDPNELKAGDVLMATKHIIMYDFIFCFYVFALPGSTFYNCYAISTLTACMDASGPAWAASMAMIGYGFATMMYLPCMYCGTCCAASSKKIKTTSKSGKTHQKPTIEQDRSIDVKQPEAP